MSERSETPEIPEADASDISLSDPAYWLQHPDELHEALADAAGIVGARSTASLTRALRDLAQAPLRVAASFVESVLPFPASTRPTPPAERLTVTVEEAGELLGISRALAYEAVRRGEIPSFRIGKRILVPKAQLERLVGTTPPNDDEAG